MFINLFELEFRFAETAVNCQLKLIDFQPIVYIRWVAKFWRQIRQSNTAGEWGYQICKWLQSSSKQFDSFLSVPGGVDRCANCSVNIPWYELPHCIELMGCYYDYFVGDERWALEIRFGDIGFYNSKFAPLSVALGFANRTTLFAQRWNVFWLGFVFAMLLELWFFFSSRLYKWKFLKEISKET